MLLFYGHFATVIVSDSAAKACISVEERVKCKLDHALRDTLCQFTIVLLATETLGNLLCRGKN